MGEAKRKAKRAESALDIAKSAYAVDWTMSDNAIAVMVDILEIYRPRRIIETGPGYSSVFLQDYVDDPKHTWPVTLFTLDERGPWAEKHVKHMRCLGFEDYSTYVFDMLAEDLFYALDDANWPSLPGWDADFMVLDGPADTRGRVSPKAIEFYKRFATKKTIWLIDDTNMPVVSALADAIFKGGGFRAVDVEDNRYHERHTALLIPEELVKLKQLDKLVEAGHA